MPHFLASSITLPPLPFESEGFCFAYEARQSRDPHSSLLLVRYGEEEFFLRKNVREKNSIVKCEKSSKSQPTGVIKDALKILMRHQDSIISHNLNNNSPRQNLSSPFIKPMDFIARLPRERLEGAMIEVGFGSGRHLLHIAQSEPQRLCVGVEIHTPSIEQVARQIELLGLENLYIIRGDARILLEILPPHIAYRIFVHFPVPWNKKPHRRVFCKQFLDEALRVLEENALLHLRSDDEIYFRDALALALSYQHINLQVQKNHQNAIVSKYEARWQRQHKDIFDLKILSIPSEIQAHHSSKIPQNAEKNFVFDKILRKNLDNYTHFPYKKIAKDWFLHIDCVYCAGDVYVLALCFGDFNQPQNKFLQISFCATYTTHYINGSPIPTRAAQKAHQHLMQFLSLTDSKSADSKARSNT